MIDDGRKLIDRLAQEKVPVIVASWVKPVEEDRWSLYIATPLLDENGATRAYREVYRVLRAMEGLWVTDSDIKIVGKDDPITRDVLDIMKRSPKKSPTRSKRPQIGTLAVEETYVYPVAGDREGGTSRQEFTVAYARKSTTNEWKAVSTRGGVIRGTEAKGAVGYSTALWEGETPADAKHATVLVLLEIDPEIERSGIEDDPELLRAITRQANLMADQKFKQHYPDAVILRDESKSG